MHSQMLITDYVIILLAFMAFDYMGLSLVLGPRFQRMAQHIGFEVKINYLGIVATYLIMLIGFFSFVDLKGSPWSAFLFGTVTHGIYELTNFSTIKGWKPEFVVLDTVWGGIVYTALFYFVNHFY